MSNSIIFIDTPSYQLIKNRMISFLNFVLKSESNNTLFDNEYGKFTVEDSIREVEEDTKIGLEIVCSSIVNNFDMVDDILKISEA
jgi:hypothetical protein